MGAGLGWGIEYGVGWGEWPGVGWDDVALGGGPRVGLVLVLELAVAVLESVWGRRSWYWLRPRCLSWLQRVAWYLARHKAWRGEINKLYYYFNLE